MNLTSHAFNDFYSFNGDETFSYLNEAALISNGSYLTAVTHKGSFDNPQPLTFYHFPIN
jgi:hypothetical protein